MAVIIKYGSAFWKKSIDLLQVTSQNYSILDKLPKNVKERVIKSMIKKLSHDEIMAAIEHLSAVCFDVKKELFIRHGSSSFLADLIRAYVDKNDGLLFAQAYLLSGETGLSRFKFSAPSVYVFQMLWQMANDRVGLDQKYVDYLPPNIFNKVLQPIILARVPPSSLMALSANMQMLASNTELQHSIFMASLDVEQTSTLAELTLS